MPLISQSIVKEAWWLDFDGKSTALHPEVVWLNFGRHHGANFECAIHNVANRDQLCAPHIHENGKVHPGAPNYRMWGRPQTCGVDLIQSHQTREITADDTCVTRYDVWGCIDFSRYKDITPRCQPQTHS